MPTIRSIGREQRRRRLGNRQRLSRPLSAALDGDRATLERVVDDLVVLHATDPATIYLSIQARLADATVELVDDALFERRSVMRTLAMRRTLFVATMGDSVEMVEASSSIDVAAKERTQLEKGLIGAGIEDPNRWLSDVADEVMQAIGDESMPARRLTEVVPRLATRIVLGSGNYTVDVNATSRVLLVMAVEGRLARGRPRGGWTDRQYRWMRRDRGPLPDPDRAAAELVACWLDRFGPGTMTDLKWWTGWTVTKTKKALAALGDRVEEVDLDGASGFDLALPGDERGAAEFDDDRTADEPWAALLPSLDPTPMGWKERDWYLDGHAAELFDRNGNIGPTIWLDGRIVGGWSQTSDGDIATELLTDVGADAMALIEARIEPLVRFIGDARFKPSFPTPLQKRLAAS